jgi:hypothetical protein
MAEPSLEERIARLEGRFANSWATHTRDEYESAFRNNCSQQIMNYVTKIVVGAVIFLVGSGYFFIRSSIRSATGQVFHEQNKVLSDELRTNIDREIRHERADYEWQRYHNYGIMYRYLCEFYENSGIKESSKHKFYLYAFGKAEQYYRDALERDAKKAQTHYELAKLYYDAARRFGVKEPRFYRPEDALQEYQLAADYYEPFEIEQGWRADAYRAMAGIYVDKLEQAKDSQEKLLDMDKGSKLLQEAQRDYEHSIDSPDVQTGLKETNHLRRRLETDAQLAHLQRL